MNPDTILMFSTGLILGVVLVALIMQHQIRLFKSNYKQKSEILLKEKTLELREQISGLELNVQSREGELDRKLKEVSLLERRLIDKANDFVDKENEILKEQKFLDSAKFNAKKLERFYRLKLHQITQMSAKEARQLLIEDTKKECAEELKDIRREQLGKAEASINQEAKQILLATMQRLSSQAMTDATATLVKLPSEELKGRIIGREGRNIRTFEHVTGTTLMMDEAPDSVLVSSFDPVRREIARIALEALVRDGRIHPASIEEEVQKSEQEMLSGIMEIGENALRKLRISNMPVELSSILGHLHYRLSNNQNTLDHSVEVANFCALLASELGYDVNIAKRAGLLHDIGKAMTEEGHESHAIAGAKFAKKHGEGDLVVNAIAAHHKEVEAKSVYASLVMIADSISAMRPGVRTSSVDGFMHRVRTIEDIAKEQHGVEDAYAIQAGKELRVIVKPEDVDEEETRQIARRIRLRIENELTYPGAIEITVIREQRFNETAV